MKVFDSELENRISEICISLIKNKSKDVPPNKLLEKMETCFNCINELIYIQKDYSIISFNSLEYSKTKRLKDCQKLLSRYCDKSLVPELTIRESEFGKGLGVFAQKSFDKHEVVMTIPVSEMITEHTAYESPFGEFLRENQLTRSMSNMSLALYLLNEKLNNQSKHSDYIESLPISVDNFLYLQLDDLRLLQHSQYFADIVHQLCTFFCHYCYFFRVLTQLQSLDSCSFKKAFCFEDFRWAVAIVMSRNTPIPDSDGKSKILALIPFWDMMNHKSGELTTDVDDGTQSLIFYAMTDYQENEEIYMDYGKRSSFNFFMYSGFIPDQNRFDAFSLKIGFNKQDSSYKIKQEILSKFSINCEGSFTIDYLKEDNILDKNLILYLTIMLAKDSRMLEDFLISSNLEEDILTYAEIVKDDIKKFLRIRIANYKTLICRSIERCLGPETVNTHRISAQLLNYEKITLETIEGKLALSS